MSVRVRFAPSPTGPLHMGGVRTALYNYLYARKHGGQFLLRIEDTDQTRFVPGAEKYIMDALKWCGILWDEGPDKGGPDGPYRQSNRKDLYKDHVMQLIDQGHAYYAFDTPEELEAMRDRLKETKSGNPQYDSQTRLSMKNALTLSEDTVQQKLDAGEPYVVRLRTPENEEVIVNDLIRGKVTVNTDQLDDKVLFKSDGMPTYHLANVVDDHLMHITHVIRGEEWLPSAPLHVLLYRVLGWENQMPAFAHLPLLLKPDGNGKLSKRDGDRLGFPVFPLEWKDPVTGEVSPGYKEEGYFPEAFINILALLGWNPGTEQEIFSLEELIDAFSLDKVGKAGARFDPEKARWFNHQYLQQKPNEEIAADFMQQIQKKGYQPDEGTMEKITDLVRERVNFTSELWDQAAFFFERPVAYDEKFAKKKWKEETPELLQALAEKLRSVDSFTTENIEVTLHAFMEEYDIGAGKIMPGLRLALVGAGKGPDVKAIMEILGKDEVIQRIEQAIQTLSR
ncbi:MAG: glutamate--tRNA ligase [Bacteroidales bacterium]